MEHQPLELFKNLIRTSGFVCLIGLANAAPAALDAWPEPADVQAFIVEMTEKHNFDRATLDAIFAPLKPNPVVLKTIAPPTDPGVRSWQRYRARFLDTPRIENGVRFWNAHAATLTRAEDAFGVPPEIVVAIIGVETEYGKNKGKFSVLDALATIAFAYPPRREFFRSELEQFLLLARENRQAPEAILGSYAGAIGIPQFMPGSQRRFAVDFDEDGRVDLMNSAQDAIGSVARFLKIHGWVAGQPIVDRVSGEIPDPAPFIATGIRPSLEAAVLMEQGLRPEQMPKHTPAALIDLITPDAATEYWWGYDNFYAITRYNRSSFYAMSVVQLADAIRARRADQRPLKTATRQPAKSGSRAKRRRAE